MFKKIKEFFVGKSAEVAASVPYKVEAAVPTVSAEPKKCGCGRSPTGYCVGLHAVSAADWETHPDNPNKTVKAEEPAPVVAYQAAVVNAAVTAAPEKKTRKPRAPKAETPAKEKAPVKTKAPKLTVIKVSKVKSKKA